MRSSLPPPRSKARPKVLLVVGHGPDLEREEGAASVLRGLGAEVRTLDLWEDPSQALRGEEEQVRVVLLEAPERPDLAAAALRALRGHPCLQGVGALVALSPSQVARLEPSSGFDDFVLFPYVPAELYARIRNLEWRRSEFATEERVKLGALYLDRSAHEVSMDGRPVALTAKEFALLAYLAERRGKVVPRGELLSRVWDSHPDTDTRTVDIHIRRLRAKLGEGLPLETVRGAGYKLSAPRDPDSP